MDTSNKRKTAAETAPAGRHAAGGADAGGARDVEGARVVAAIVDGAPAAAHKVGARVGQHVGDDAAPPREPPTLIDEVYAGARRSPTPPPPWAASATR